MTREEMREQGAEMTAFLAELSFADAMIIIMASIDTLTAIHNLDNIGPYEIMYEYKKGRPKFTVDELLQ